MKHLLAGFDRQMLIIWLPLLHVPSLGSCQDLQLACSVLFLSESNKIVFGFPSESVIKLFY